MLYFLNKRDHDFYQIFSVCVLSVPQKMLRHIVFLLFIVLFIPSMAHRSKSVHLGLHSYELPVYVCICMLYVCKDVNSITDLLP